MKKIEITLTNEQYDLIQKEIKTGAKLNLNHETFSGFQMIITDFIPGISNLEIQVYNKVDIGEVNWEFK